MKLRFTPVIIQQSTYAAHMICSFIPPHIAKKVAENDHSFALGIRVDKKHRAAREETAHVAGPITVYSAGNRTAMPGSSSRKRTSVPTGSGDTHTSYSRGLGAARSPTAAANTGRATPTASSTGTTWPSG